MVTIQGKIKHEGVAIAVIAKVDSVSGINGVAAEILEEGIKSIRKGLAKCDYPEVVVACDNVLMGVSIKIPGINTIGIAAEADMDVPGLEVDVPCVIGLEGLLVMVGQGSLMIIDGNKGQVHIDPDTQTLITYQHLQDDKTSRSKLFIASEHIPARTQAGDTVFVYAHIKNEGQVNQALEEGADGLLIDLRGSEAEAADFYRALMRAAPGKPLVFAVDFPCRILLETTTNYAAPGQVTVAFPPPQFDELILEVSAHIENNPDSSEIKIGCVAMDAEASDCRMMLHRLIIDLPKPSALKQMEPQKMQDKVERWIGSRDAESALVLIGRNVDAVEKLVNAGVRSIAVAPDKVGSAKYKIRSIGAEE